MAKWAVLFAYRDAEGMYNDKVRKVVEAETIQDAISITDQILQNESKEGNWKCYRIWDCGIMTDVDEEVC